MTAASLALIALFLVAVLLCAKPMGLYIANVMEGRRIWPLRMGGGIERLLYRLCGVDPGAEMGWKKYAIALLVFNTLGALVVYALQRLQLWSPLNPPAVRKCLAGLLVQYGGELHHQYQLAGLLRRIHHELSDADGRTRRAELHVGGNRHRRRRGADPRPRTAQRADHRQFLGGHHALHAVHPAAAVAGVRALPGLAGCRTELQRLQGCHYARKPRIPAAEARRCRQRSEGRRRQRSDRDHHDAHADPADGSDGLAGSHQGTRHQWRRVRECQLGAWLRESLAADQLLRDAGDAADPGGADLHLRAHGRRHAAGVGRARIHGHPVRGAAGDRQLQRAAGQSRGGETRCRPGGERHAAGRQHGRQGSALRHRGVDAVRHHQHQHLHRRGEFHARFVHAAGRLRSAVQHAAGRGGVRRRRHRPVLDAGVRHHRCVHRRSDDRAHAEYVGKKIEAFEMKMSAIAILVMPLIVLMGTAVAVSVPVAQAGVANPGAHGFSEILYAFSSAGNNNGSCFCGLSANTPFYNTALGIAMWLGRFWPIVAVLAIAGSLAAKKRVPVTSGTMLTYGPTFVILLIGTVLLVGALTFVPALALGPVVEHLTLWGG